MSARIAPLREGHGRLPSVWADVCGRLTRQDQAGHVPWTTWSSGVPGGADVSGAQSTSNVPETLLQQLIPRSVGSLRRPASARWEESLARVGPGLYVHEMVTDHWQQSRNSPLSCVQIQLVSGMVKLWGRVSVRDLGMFQPSGKLCGQRITFLFSRFFYIC